MTHKRYIYVVFKIYNDQTNFTCIRKIQNVGTQVMKNNIFGKENN